MNDMNSGVIKILLVEDNPGDARLVREMLAEGNGDEFDLAYVDQLSKALKRLNEGPFDMVLLDLSLPDSHGLKTMMAIRASAPDIPIVVLSGLQDEAVALQAVQNGAQDYMVKGQVNSSQLTRSLHYAIERNRQDRTLKAPARQQATVSELGQLVLEETDLSIVMHKSVTLVAQTLEVAYCGVFELLPNGHGLLRWGVGWKEGYVGNATVGAITNSQAGYALLWNKPVIVDDIRTETRFKIPPLFHDHQVVSGMSAIIHSRDRPFGVLEAHTTKRRTFTQEDIHFLQAVANVLATTIERKHVQDRLNYLAHYDSLTDLPNRQLFVDRLIQALALAKRHQRLTAILFLDLDRFKLINDSLGHDTGSLLLKAVSNRLTNCVRSTDSVARSDKEGYTTTVARLGGDEFTVLLVEIENVQDSAKVAQRILDMLHQSLTLEGNELIITASIGISLYPSDGDNEETLIRNASAAMFRAKEQGGNNFQFYSSEMNARASERLGLEMSLRKALERKEFIVHYQPQVDLQTGQIIGMEALLRWQHSDRGLISPAQFIPLAEETGLIVPIGEWVLRTACAQNKAWQAAGFPPMRVAVNLSARQFRHRNLAETIVQILKETGLDSNYLELELTESILMQDVEVTIEMLSKLRAMGMQLSIDDFGTGYSSLSYLKRFPIDKLKIDQSFVRDLTTDPDDAAIVKSIITLSQSLKLKAIAEGVETMEQAELLRSLECNEMQGYLFSRPLPADEAAKLLAENRRF